MLGSIYIGLSGLNAYSKGLQTISNNVANLNTPGFKASTVRFSDRFTSGGGGLTYTSSSGGGGAGGVGVSDDGVDFHQGDLRASEGDLDLAIQGAGFLVLKDGDKTLYTRTGQFAVDEDGYIALQGTKNRLAVLDDANQAITLRVDDKRLSKPVATTKITLSDNLSSGGTEHTISNIAVYDSTGAKHIWQLKFQAVGASAPGEWNITVTDATGATVGTSKVKFIGAIVDSSTSQLTITSSPAGADPLAVTLDFSSGVTSYSSGTTSSLRAASTDGNGVGTITNVTVEEGKVKLAYSNGKSELAGSIALADFRDPQSLKRIGGGLFEAEGTGMARLVASGEGGAGSVVSKQLEASNVNLSDEFGDLILIQRGFQASSQVVSVANDMIQQLFGIRGQG